jgi:hypothetical protein
MSAKTKFTKGIWVNNDLDISSDKTDIAMVLGYDPDNSGFNICNECEANASLIAVAPEMYEELEKLLCLEGIIDTSKIKALLAKARGE